MGQPPPPKDDDRAARLAEQLRANLRRRKAQARQIATDMQDEKPADR